MGGAIRCTTKRAKRRPRVATEASGMFAIVKGVCSIFEDIGLFFEGYRFHVPESITNFWIGSGVSIGHSEQVLPILVAICAEVCCSQFVFFMHYLFQFVLEV